MIRFFREHPEVLPILILVMIMTGLMPEIHNAFQAHLNDRMMFDPGIRIERLVIR